MKNTTLCYIPVNLKTHLAMCIAFRKSAHLISYGSLKTFSADATTAYFNKISTKHGYMFLHVYSDGEVIGQLEFSPHIKTEGRPDIGYINLLYLKKEHRGLGLGKTIHDYAIKKIQEAGNNIAELRFIPGNNIAEQFYTKNGWIKVGEPTERGQLARLTF